MANSGKMPANPLDILLVEDNADHAELILRCLRGHRLPNVIHHLTDGEAALAYLRREGAYADPAKSPHPNVVLLDLRIPKIDGLEVLREVKNSPDLRAIPIVVLTTSHAEKDTVAAYMSHANSYLVKPLDPRQFAQLIDDLGFYWMGWNRSPWSWRPH